MKNYLLLLSTCFIFANNQYPTESQINQMIEQSMQLIWETAMEGKKTLNNITRQTDILLTKEGRKKMVNSIKVEMEKAVNKENYLKKDERVLINKFINGGIH